MITHSRNKRYQGLAGYVKRNIHPYEPKQESKLQRERMEECNTGCRKCTKTGNGVNWTRRKSGCEQTCLPLTNENTWITLFHTKDLTWTNPLLETLSWKLGVWTNALLHNRWQQNSSNSAKPVSHTTRRWTAKHPRKISFTWAVRSPLPSLPHPLAVN